MPSLDKGFVIDPAPSHSSEQSATDVAAYLQTHPNFLREWVESNIQSPTVQQLLEDQTLRKQNHHEEVLAYHERSRDGRNSITAEIFNNLTMGRKRSGSHKSAKILRDDVKSMSDDELFMALIRDISNELDVDLLCHKILVNVSILTNSDRSSLFLAKGSRNNRYLIPQLFDVTADSVLQDQENLPDIKIPFGVGIAGHVAKTKESIMIKDAYKDQRFNKAVDKQTGYKTVSIMCKPICNNEDEVIGVAQIINKYTGDHQFTSQDELVFEKYLTFCGIGIQNAQLFELSVLEYKRNQLMLNLAKCIFEEQSDLEKLIAKIMSKAKELLLVERCGVYLVDDKNEDEEIQFGTALELRSDAEEIIRPSFDDISKSGLVELAKKVATTGQHLNIDLTEDNYTADQLGEEDLEVQTVLSMPIHNGESKIIGAALLINKKDSTSFNTTDVNTFEAFAIFCGLGIHNAQAYDNACKLMAKQKVALEVLSFHATATQDETNSLMVSQVSQIPTPDFFKIYSFDFNDFAFSEDQTVYAAIRMFLEWDVINKFKVPYETLCRWVLSVKKNYRPVIYHNWRHALNVAQTMFAMLTTGNMMRFVTPLEAFGLVVACLCHDLDHRGTNNTFQTKTASALAQLYGTSTMEHHHFDQCIMILNSEGNNIFQSLSSDDYRMIIHMIEAAIISTDLALYFKKKGKFIELVENSNTKFATDDEKELLRAMMMTACDVSAITKPWEIQKQVADLVSSEFFEQGDLEKTQLNEKPIAMMDREKRDELPKMQVGFIDFICLPVYKAFSEFNMDLSPLYDGVRNNRSEWQKLDEAYQNRDVNDGNTTNSLSSIKNSASRITVREKCSSQSNLKQQKVTSKTCVIL